MNTQMKRLVTLSAVVVGLTIISNNAFALGRSKHSGYRGWTNSNTGSSNDGSTSGGSTSGGSPFNGDAIGNTPGGSNCNTAPLPGGNDSNPVPEPAGMLMLGSAIAGFGGYRGLRKRLLKQ